MYFRSCFSILITDIVKWNIHVLLKIFIADYVHFNISKLESLRRGRNVFVWCWSWKVKNGWFLFPPHLSFFFVFFFVTVNVNQGKKKRKRKWEPVHDFPVWEFAACYRRSFPFRWIFKIFPSLCFAVAMPFFSRFAGREQDETDNQLDEMIH